MIARIFLGVLIGGAIGVLLGYFGKCSSGTCPLTANPYRGAIYGAVMGALVTLAFSQTPKQKEASSNIVHIESWAGFKTNVLDALGICLVDLFSNRCPPCRILAPTISSLADKYVRRVTVCKVDVDRVPEVAQRYAIRAIPTVLIISNGKEVKRLLGLRTEVEYVALLDKLTDGTKEQVSN
jgi:thioredoxin 1